MAGAGLEWGWRRQGIGWREQKPAVLSLSQPRRGAYLTGLSPAAHDQKPEEPGRTAIASFATMAHRFGSGAVALWRHLHPSRSPPKLIRPQWRATHEREKGQDEEPHQSCADTPAAPPDARGIPSHGGTSNFGRSSRIRSGSLSAAISRPSRACRPPQTESSGRPESSCRRCLASGGGHRPTKPPRSL